MSHALKAFVEFSMYCTSLYIVQQISLHANIDDYVCNV